MYKFFIVKVKYYKILFCRSNMTDNRTTEQTEVNCNPIMPYVLNTNESGGNQTIQNSNHSILPIINSRTAFNYDAREEHSRTLADNASTTNHPFTQHATVCIVKLIYLY